MGLKAFLLGVVAGVIATWLERWILFLLSRPAKSLWTWIQTRQKVRFAAEIKNQIKLNQQSLDRLNHMAANPRDLYIYLFQLGVTGFICVSMAIFVLLIMPPGTTFFQYHSNLGATLISPYLLAASLLMLFGILFCSLAMWEANRMSVRRFDITVAALEKTISGLTAKLTN